MYSQLNDYVCTGTLRLQLYIYDRMKKKGLHNVAEIFSKEVNLEMSECKCVHSHIIVDYALFLVFITFE